MLLRTAIAASILAAVSLGGPSTPEQEPSAAYAAPGDKVSPQAAVLGQPFQIKFGDTVQLSDVPLSVTFDKVVEDSRCPIKVQCVWAGRVVVDLSATQMNGPTNTFQVQQGASTQVHSYTVTLNKVDPPKTGEMPPSDDSYVLTLTVTNVAQ